MTPNYTLFICRYKHNGIAFCRVITTSRKVAEIEEASLVSCLHYITPNWLQSLLLEAPKELNLMLTLNVINKLTKCPQECLENLQKVSKIIHLCFE